MLEEAYLLKGAFCPRVLFAAHFATFFDAGDCRKLRVEAQELVADLEQSHSGNVIAAQPRLLL